MPKSYFLSYSSTYKHLLIPFKNLMEALGMPVRFFDYPDMEPVNQKIKDELRSCDGIVVLYGPHQTPAGPAKDLPAAPYPHDEANIALGMGKSLAFVIHEGTRPPNFLHQTAARFDFWSPDSFRDNVHHIVKHLLDLKRLVEMEGESQPFRITNAEFRHRILSHSEVRVEVYHQVVARETRKNMHHKTSVGDDRTSGVTFPKPDQIKFQMYGVVGDSSRKLQIHWTDCDAGRLEYYLEMAPPLQPGEEFGYVRSYELPNWFPLTRQEIAERSRQPGYPVEYGDRCYGGYAEVVFDMDQVTYAFYFPPTFKLAGWQMVARDMLTKTENQKETQRCQPFVQWKEEGIEKYLEMSVPRPLMNHNYYLLYEPKN